MKISWITYYGTDENGNPEFIIHRADEEVILYIRSELSKSTKEAIERSDFKKGRELIEMIEEIDNELKAAKEEAPQKESTNG